MYNNINRAELIVNHLVCELDIMKDIEKEVATCGYKLSEIQVKKRDLLKELLKIYQEET